MFSRWANTLTIERFPHLMNFFHKLRNFYVFQALAKVDDFELLDGGEVSQLDYFFAESENDL